MKVCIFTLGSRGDVQPYVALAKELIRQGHRAVICTGESFRKLIEENGVGFHRTESDLMAFANTEDGKAILEAPAKNWRLAMRYSRDLLNPAYRKTLDDFYEAALDADMILYHPKALGAVDIALYFGIPCVSMPPVPITYPTPEFPNLALTTKNFGSFFNKLSYQINAKAESSQMAMINDFRQKTLGLPKRKPGVYAFKDGYREIPTVYPISGRLFPEVKSWENHVFLPGFFFLESGERLDPKLERFLAAGQAPIAVTFSSMPLKNPNIFLEKLKTALKETGNRAVLLTGNSGIPPIDDPNLYVAKAVPHDLLFPRCKGVLHHGGVGTMAAALRSGVPQLIMPGSTDQPFWAKRLHGLDLAPAPLKEKNLTVETLSGAFCQFDDPIVQEKARAAGVDIRNENGTVNAVWYLEQLKESW